MISSYPRSEWGIGSTLESTITHLITAFLLLYSFFFIVLISAHIYIDFILKSVIRRREKQHNVSLSKKPYLINNLLSGENARVMLNKLYLMT